MGNNPHETIRALGTTFHSLLGYELVRCEQGLAVAKLKVGPEHLNTAGLVHGGVFCSLLDIVCGFAGGFYDEDKTRKHVVTLSFNTLFIAAATGGTLHVVGKLVGGGSKTYFAEAEIRDENGRLVATGSGVFKYIKNKPND